MVDFHLQHVIHILKAIGLEVNFSYQSSLLDHPTRRQNCIMHKIWHHVRWGWRGEGTLRRRSQEPCRPGWQLLQVCVWQNNNRDDYNEDDGDEYEHTLLDQMMITMMRWNLIAWLTAATQSAASPGESARKTNDDFWKRNLFQSGPKSGWEFWNISVLKNCLKWFQTFWLKGLVLVIKNRLNEWEPHLIRRKYLKTPEIFVRNDFGVRVLREILHKFGIKTI